jgi:RNase H-fold protein (predicted Holliday junction resolvase)
MPRNPASIGLSIGTRKIGIAVITKTNLDCAKVWVFPGRWNEKKLYRILQRVHRKVIKFSVTSLSLKVPTPTHHTIGLKQLIVTIKGYCAKHNILLHVCTIQELKAHGISDGRKNKKVLVQTLGDKYPQLHHIAQKELKNRNSHHTKMFEAVAAAELLQNILDQHKQK